MKKLFKNAAFWRAYPTPAFTDGELLVENGSIIAHGAPGTLSAEDAETVDLGGALVAPGLVDIHTHGRAGGDFSSADTATLCRMARSYLASGTTTVMPTLASAPLDDYVTAAARIAATCDTPNGARWLGLHLEGRYLHPAKRGAHASELLAPPNAGELNALHERMCRPFIQKGLPIPFRAAAALELDTDGSFAAMARSLGIRLALGHTTATYEQAMSAIAQGAGAFTHLFNAMPPLHHRGGGAVAACLEAAAQGMDVYGELICDGVHISPEMVRLAYRSLGPEHTLLITDSMAGAGCPDGQYFLAGLRVTVKDGRALTDDGTIAGSTLSLWQAVKNLSDFCHIPLSEAICCATHNPARLCGLEENLGSLEVGARADLLVIDPDRITPVAVYLAGEPCTEVDTV